MANLLRIYEAAIILQHSPATLRNWMKADQIDYVTFPSGERRIPLSEIERILKTEAEKRAARRQSAGGDAA